MTKLNRNSKCNCNSGKKYKNCCFNSIIETKYTTGQPVSSQRIVNMVEILQKRFPNYRFIDISDDLDDSNYKEYQIKNFNNNIVMVAEKKLKNSLVFIEREETTETDIIIMHRGSYRSFIYDHFERVIESLADMIK
jgi:hypothetical protein